MNRRYFPFLFLIIAALSLAGKSYATPPAIVYIPADTTISQVISGHMVSVLEDKKANLTLQQVIQHDTAFKESNAAILNLGVSPSAFWLRINILNSSAAYHKGIIEIQNPMIDDVVLFQQDSSGAYVTDTISKNYPFSYRTIERQNPSFFVNLAEGQTRTIYLRVSATTQLLLPLRMTYVSSYMPPDTGRDILSAIYFGIMLVMFLYNLFIYFTVRDNSYLYYVLYILCVACVQLNITGFGYKYLWYNFPWLERHAAVLFSVLTAYATVAFVRRFLHTRTFIPRMHKGLWIFVVGYTLALICSVWANPYVAYNLINLLGLFISFYVIGAAAYIWFTRKYRPALFFLISWSVFFSGVILFVLKDFGVLPYNLFTVSVLQLGSAIETIFLSFALADRINVLKREKETSQALALEAARENERIIKEQNIVLEQKVTERTMELSTANTSLNTALTDLKGAQSQLVESEKMASLGQLTAGIAHEINNPINFVIANVRPLRRDIDLMKDTLVQIEELAVGDMPVADVKKKIASIKEDVEYDYLTTEIEFLLKGISEGSERTAEIVKGLRIFARVDEDDLKRANIHEGIDSTTVIVNTLLNNCVVIEKHYADLPMIECYPGKLNQVFLNIITNGIHAINKRFGEAAGGKITISTRRDDEHVFVDIQDNGVGMSTDVLDKIFDPFFTTKDVGEGTGLGLSIAYNIIKKHDGKISATSKVGEGTVFNIELPLLQS